MTERELMVGLMREVVARVFPKDHASRDEIAAQLYCQNIYER